MKTDFTADAFLGALYPRLTGDPFAAARDAESAAGARDALRKKLRNCLGLPELEEMDCGGAPAPVDEPVVAKDYAARKYAFEVLPGLVTPVCCFCPPDAKKTPPRRWPCAGTATGCGRSWA